MSLQPAKARRASVEARKVVERRARWVMSCSVHPICSVDANHEKPSSTGIFSRISAHPEKRCASIGRMATTKRIDLHNLFGVVRSLAQFSAFEGAAGRTRRVETRAFVAKYLGFQPPCSDSHHIAQARP